MNRILNVLIFLHKQIVDLHLKGKVKKILLKIFHQRKSINNHQVEQFQELRKIMINLIRNKTFRNMHLFLLCTFKCSFVNRVVLINIYNEEKESIETLHFW